MMTIILDLRRSVSIKSTDEDIARLVIRSMRDLGLSPEKHRYRGTN